MLRYCSALSLLFALGACSYKAQKLDLDVGSASTLTTSGDAFADGVDAVTVTLSLKHYDGTPAAGLNVQLRVSDPNDTLVAGGAAVDPNGTLTTDASGRVTASFTSRFPGQKVLTSTLVQDGQRMALRTASVNFKVPTSLPRLYVSASNISPTAGEAFSVTLTVVDALGATQKGYLGTVLLTASDPNAILPGQVTFAPSDAGTKVVQSVVFKGAGTRYLTGTDAALPGLTTQTPLVVQPAAVAGFQIAVSGSPTAGQAAGITVTAVDAYNNVVPTYVGQVTITANDPNNTNGVPATAGTLTPSFSATDQGQINLPGVLTLQRTNNQVTLTVTGPSPGGAGAPLSSTQGPFVVSPAAADHLALSLDVNQVNAGGNVVAQLAVQDVFNNLVTPYAGTVRIGSSDTRAIVPPAYTFNPNTDGGQHRFTVTLNTANPNAVVTAQDANGPPPAAGAAGVAVLPVGPYLAGAWTSTSDNTAAAGSAQTLTVRAYNLDGSAMTSYSGTVALTSTDPNATLGGPITLASGQGTATVTHTTAGQQYVTLVDTQNPNMAGTSHALSVLPGPAARYLLAGGNAVAGVPYPFSITAKDAYGNTATSYTGRADLTTTDTRAVIGNRQFNASDAGVVQATVLFKTADAQVINANDSVAGGAITGSLTVKVAPGAPGNFAVRLSPNPAVAGQPVSASVDVRDSYGNATPSYTGTLTWRTANANAVLPPDYTFTTADAGSHTFANGMVFYSASTSSVVASDANQSTLNGASLMVVNPNVPTRLTLTGPAARSVAGTAFQVVLAATDQYGNITPNVNATVHYSSDDPNSAGLPADAALSASGQQTNSVKLFTAGARTLNANVIAGSAGIAAASLTLGVNPADANTLTFTNVSASYVAGTPLGFQVNAKDAFGNSATGYTGTVLLTSTDAAFTAGQYAFTATDLGSHTFSNTLHTAGNQNVLVQDSTTPGLKGTLVITVLPGAATGFAIRGLADGPAGAAQNCNVVATDAYGNRATGYTGTVSFISTDPNAVLPGTYTYVTTDLGRRTFAGVSFKTAGAQTFTVSDGSISGGVTVNIRNAPASVLRFSGNPNQVTAGALFTARVTAYDTYNNVATDFNSTVSFTTSPSGSNAATLPAAYTYSASDAGSHNNPNAFSLNVVPSMTLTASSSSANPISGSVTLAVQASDANSLMVTTSSQNANAGTPMSVTVKALDKYNNTAVNYTGTVAFSSNDTYPQTTLPGSHTFVASDSGVYTVTNGVTLTKAQSSASVRATDVNLANVTGAQTGIVVKGLAASQLMASGLADPTTAGTNQRVVLSATDNYTNVDANYSRTVSVSITTSDHNALLPSPNPGFISFANGMSSVNGLQLRTAGPQDVRAVTSTLSAPALTVTVVASPTVTSIGFDPNTVPSTVSTCAAITPAVRVLVYDTYGNVITSNSNNIQMTAQNGNLFGTTKQPVQGGAATFGDLSFDTAGQSGLHATIPSSGFSANSNAITVTGATGAPSMALSTVTGSAGCLDLTFTVSACGAPVTLQPRFANPKASNPNLAAATLASSSPAGLYGVPSARAITLRWDSVRDVGHRNGNYNFDIGAQVNGGVQGHLSNVVSVANAPKWSSIYTVPGSGVPVQSLAVADFNHDGKPDTVAVDGNMVILWLGPAGGVSTQSLGTGTAPVRVVAGDINRDGLADAVVCATGASNSSSVWYLLGQANGTLGGATKNALFTACSELALADVNHDGFLDAISIDSVNNTLQWNRAYPQGTGSVGASTLLAFAPKGLPVAADFTGDGNTDLAVAISGNGNTVAMFPGTGKGFGTAFSTSPGFLYTFALAAGDIDNNGTTDLVATNGTQYTAYTAMSGGGFGGVNTVNVADNANSIRLADADGDGLLDLFVRSPNSLLVYAGPLATQPFTTPLFSAALNGPADFAVADLSHDGLPDVMLNEGATFERWYNQMPRSCDGARFGATLATPVAPTPSGMAVADFDRDGKFDVFVAHGGNGNNALEVYRGDGAGGLALKSNALNGNAVAQYGLPAAGDLNGDGLVDVAVPVQDGRVLVFAGDGNGNFGAAATYAVDPNAGQVVIADVNSDGRKDMLVTTSVNASFDILLAPNFTKQTNNVGFSATRITVGSVTAANRNDVVLSNSAGFVVITNDGSGTLNTVTTSRPVPLKGLVIADITQDGNNDLVVANEANNELDIYVGDGSGAYSASAISRGTVCPPAGIASADLDGVNGPDLVVLCNNGPAGTAPSGLTILYNNGSGSAAYYTFSPTVGGLTDLAIRDMSSDGYPDVLVLSPGANNLSLALNMGVSASGGAFFGQGHLNINPNSVGAALADINGDGALDVVVGNSNTAAVHVYGSTLPDSGQAFSTNAQPQSVCTADIDNDGDQDIIAGDFGGSDVVIERNITTRGSSSNNFVPSTLAINAPVTAVAVGDINNDGIPDVVAGTTAGYSVRFGASGGTTAAAGIDSIPGGNAPTTGIALGDLNGDGWLDLALTAASSNTVYFYFNDGSGNLSTTGNVSVNSGPTGIALGDIDGDGKLDVVVALANGPRMQVAVIINQGNNNFASPSVNDSSVTPSGGVMARDLVLADVNQDGRLDALVPSLRDYGVGIFLNAGLTGVNTFNPPTSFVALGSGMRSVAVGDMNHDGRPDLVLVDDLDSQLDVADGR